MNSDLLLWLPGILTVVFLLRRVGLLEGFWPAMWSRLIVGRRGRSSPLGWFFRLIIFLYILQWLLLVMQQRP